MKHPWIAAILVATIFIVFRIITATQPNLANFSPIVALLFCGAAFWKSNKWMLPTVFMIWLISSPILNLIHGFPLHSSTLVTLVAFIVVGAIGISYAGKSPIKLIFGTIIGASAFYLITNTVAFITDPTYTKTLEGYIQCMWTGSPLHMAPTWTIFRNSLIANSLGTSFFVLAMNIPAIKDATQFKLTNETT